MYQHSSDSVHIIGTEYKKKIQFLYNKLVLFLKIFGSLMHSYGFRKCFKVLVQSICHK